MTLIYECLDINLFKGEIPFSRVIFINENCFLRLFLFPKSILFKTIKLVRISLHFKRFI